MSFFLFCRFAHIFGALTLIDIVQKVTPGFNSIKLLLNKNIPVTNLLIGQVLV